MSNNPARRGRTLGLGRAAGLGPSLAALSVAALVAATLGAAPAAASTKPDAKTPSRSAFQARHQQVGSVPAGLTAQPSRAQRLRAAGAGTVDADLQGLHGQVSVMLELDPAPAVRTFTANRSRGTAVATDLARRQVSSIETAQRAVTSRLGASATRAKVLYRAKNVYSGVAVRTDASRLKALSALPGVKGVHRITPKKPTNSSSVPLIGAPAAWQSSGSGQTGAGVKVGIIDTGIDYTHADFGGAGTKAAYVAAHATADSQAAWTPTAKVVGGTDFVGDDYDGASTDPGTEAVPDPNPLDCDLNGHGSHVAGTAAGYGVTAAGDTYTGGYATSIPADTFSVGPGVAPDADLYALRVFGCEGSTDVVTEALEWAADPNGDGSFADKLDVVNMSLGSDYGSPEDPDAVASNNLAASGTVVVASIGNSGDVYEVGGSPGDAARVISVAASDDGHDVVDGLQVDSPAGIEPAGTVDGVRDNRFGALKSVAFDWDGPDAVDDSDDASLTDLVVDTGDWSAAPSASNNTDGCDPYSTADQAKIAGKIVLQYWTEGTSRRCGSAARGTTAEDAGATGIIFGSDENAFSAGVTGSAVIPAMLVVKQATDAIRGQLHADPAVAVTATMDNVNRNSVTIVDAGKVDTVATFSSRGIGMAGNIKPDVAAPGVTTFSAKAGSGDEGFPESGTSMASPHVAGEAALVVGQHPTWTVEQVKAAIVNTATQDVFTGDNRTGDVYGPERVGAGRVKADQAVKASTLAYVKDDVGAVGVSFGPLAVTGVTTRSKTVTVQNTATSGPAKTYSLAYRGAVATPGVKYSVAPSTVSVAAGHSVSVSVTLLIDASQLRHTPDPTTDADPLGVGLQRSYRTDASGRLVLTPTGSTGGSSLRVPVWSAPRPAAAMTAQPSLSVSGAGTIQTGDLELAGRPLDQGSMAGSYYSTVSAFQLQMSSPKLPTCPLEDAAHQCVSFPDERGADLRYVGTTSDGPVYTDAGLSPYKPYADDPACATSDSQDCMIPPALLSFGISSWGPWRTPAGFIEHDVYLDGNGDKVPDAVTYNTRATASTDGFDYFLAVTVDLRPGKDFAVIDQQLVNGVDGSFETGLFNSDSLVMPVSLYSLKDAGIITSADPDVRYQVQSVSYETGLVDGDSSSSPWKSVNVQSPALGATGVEGFSTLSTDSPDAMLSVRRDATSVPVDKPLGLLLIHHLNADGARAQVVSVRSRTTTSLSVSPTSYTYGGRPVLTAKVTPTAAAGALTGTVTFRDGAKSLGAVRLAAGSARLTLSSSALVRGTHSLTAVYGGDSQNVSSASKPVKVTVKGLRTTTTLTSGDTAYGHGGRPTVTAKVSPSAATGTVAFRDGSRWLAAVKVTKGSAHYRLPVLKRGTHYLTATYGGSSKYEPDASPRLKITVR